MKNILALTFLFATTVQAGVDYTQFSLLYQKDKNLEEATSRLNKMEELRKSAQTSLERLLTKGANVDLELRYAELIVQRGRDLEQFSLELNASGDLKRSKELSDLSKKLLRQGLALHSKLLAHVKNHPLAAKVYLGMAKTHYSLGQKSDAFNDADAGLKFVKQQPKHDETELYLWVLRGDAAFDMAKAPLALQSYAKAKEIVSPASFEEAYLDYKLAWCEYNLKDSESALKDLDHLLSVTRDKFALRQEAIQDYALFLADLPNSQIEKRGNYQGVFLYLSENSDAATATKGMERLGQVYAKNGRRADAIKTFDFLIADNSLDADNVDRAITVVEWTHSLADKSKLTDKYFWLINNFGPKSTWFAAQEKNLKVKSQAIQKIEVSVRKYAILLHQEVNRESSEELRKKKEDVVAKLYDAHIDNFSELVEAVNSEAARIHFYRAEIYRNRKEWAEAGARYDHYLKTLELSSGEKVDKIDQKLKQEAVWGSVVVWAKAIEKDPKYVPEMLAACDLFLKESPKSEKAAQILLDAALVELKVSNTPMALSRLDQLVQKYPHTPQASLAVHAALDVYNKEKDWINLATSARKYINNIDTWALAKEKTKMSQELNIILSQTEAKACEALQQSPGRQIEAALCFESFARGFAKDVQAPKALLIASEIYDKMKDASAAVQVLETLVKKYPESEYAASGFSRLATVYERAFEFEKAVSIYETLLSRNTQLADRERLTTRLLTLLSSLGETKKFEEWLAKKSTTDAIRNEYAHQAIEKNVFALRAEEIQYGYDQDSLAGPKAKKIYADLELNHKLGKLSPEHELEYRRIKGHIYRAEGKLDKADEEWMAAMKLYWKTSPKSDRFKETAARIHLARASMWESAFRNTDVMKNPARKAELFKKLEAWYAEVIEMRSPAVALEALWASAELNTKFSEELREAPTPPELLQKGMETQLAAYKKLIHERTEPLKQKAIVMIERISQLAREWKVISPVVISSLKVISNLRAGVDLPGQVVQVSESNVLQFPWPELPRWIDLADEQKGWEEWSLSGEELKKLMTQSGKRSEMRRAAFVSLTRKNSLKDSTLLGWSKTFTDRPGVQLRIQAMLHDGDLERAALFLDQYESFFGMDSFSDHYWGRLEWARGNYSVAYLKWVRPTLAEAQRDFRNLYWTEGWNSMFDELGEGIPSQSRREQVYKRLVNYAREDWQKVYLANLCLTFRAECKDGFAPEKVGKVLSQLETGALSYQFQDSRSGWDIHKKTLVTYVEYGLNKAKNLDELDQLRKAMATLYQMKKLTDESKTHVTDYWTLNAQIDRLQDQLDLQNKQRVLAGAKQ